VQTVFPGVKSIMTLRVDSVKQPFPRRCIRISDAKKGTALQRIFLTSDKAEGMGAQQNQGIMLLFSVWHDKCMKISTIRMTDAT